MCSYLPVIAGRKARIIYKKLQTKWLGDEGRTWAGRNRIGWRHFTFSTWAILNYVYVLLKTRKRKKAMGVRKMNDLHSPSALCLAFLGGGMSVSPDSTDSSETFKPAQVLPPPGSSLWTYLCSNAHPSTLKSVDYLSLSLTNSGTSLLGNVFQLVRLSWLNE